MPDPNMARWPDERLMSAAACGNDDAFVVFCRRSLPSTLRYAKLLCRQNGLSEEHAMDITQEAYLRAVKNIKKRLSLGRQLPKVSSAWIKRIALTVLIDSGRAQKRRPEKVDIALVEDKVAVPVPNGPTQDEQLEEIRKYFTWLPDMERELIDLMYVGGLSLRDAGTRLGMSYEGAKKAHQRGLEKLRDFLQVHGSQKEKATVR
jgi:RNA polymerase sigma factor (sigma-70 family)